jgi:hypothetical protein
MGGNRPAVSVPSDQNTTTGMHNRESEVIKIRSEHTLNQSVIKYIKLGLLQTNKRSPLRPNELLNRRAPSELVEASCIPNYKPFIH